MRAQDRKRRGKRALGVMPGADRMRRHGASGMRRRGRVCGGGCAAGAGASGGCAGRRGRAGTGAAVAGLGVGGGCADAARAHVRPSRTHLTSAHADHRARSNKSARAGRMRAPDRKRRGKRALGVMPGAERMRGHAGGRWMRGRGRVCGGGCVGAGAGGGCAGRRGRAQARARARQLRAWAWAVDARMRAQPHVRALGACAPAGPFNTISGTVEAMSILMCNTAAATAKKSCTHAGPAKQTEPV
jgi:hypothetical protein